MDKAARWGDLESEEEEEEEEEAEEEVSDDEATAEDTIADGLSSVASGYSSLPSGIETPDVLDLRKAKAAGAPPLLSTPCCCIAQQLCPEHESHSCRQASVPFCKQISNTGPLWRRHRHTDPVGAA